MDTKIESQINAEQISLQIIMRLRQIMQEMSKHSKLILEKYKISTPQLICLNEVFQHGPISIGALTKIVFLNNSTVTGIVDRLEKRELVKRIRVSKDRRQVHVEITDQGIAFINEAPKPIQDQFMDRLLTLDEDKIGLILWSLEMLVDMLGNKDTTLQIPMPPSHITRPNDMTNLEDEL
jgi:DNA-binding MarR family transcriptional regulator